MSENIGNPFPQEPKVETEKINVEKLYDLAYLPAHEELTEALKTIKNGSGWVKFTDHYIGMELLNKEFIRALSDHIVLALGLENDQDGRVFTVLEVGAGNGRLAHFVKQELDLRFPNKVKVIASDSGEYGYESIFPVEKLDCEAALEKYKPQMVICAWMTPDQDFSKVFRADPSVKEYLLIGEPGGYGSQEMFEDDRGKYGTPSYQKDGFSKTFLNEVEKYQVCVNDSPSASSQGSQFFHSDTLAYRREK